MTTVIRLKPDELTTDFLKKLKGWVKGNNYLEIKISDSQEGANNLSDKEILSRKSEIDEGKGMSFTMEEFETYVNKNFSRE